MLMDEEGDSQAPVMFTTEDESPARDGEITESTQLVPRDDLRPTMSYATRKTCAEGALLGALLMANASQLTVLLVVPDNRKGIFFIPVIVFIAIAILLQIVVGIVLLILGFSNPKTTAAVNKTVWLNNLSVILILVITGFNVFITAFSVTYVEEDK